MKNTFGKALSLTALASAMVLSSCQKEDMMEDQFSAPTDVQQASGKSGQAIEGQYIVVFQDGSTGLSSSNSALVSATIRQSVMAQSGIEANAVKETFQGSVKGFAAKLSAQQLQELRNNPDVAYIEQDRVISLDKSVGAAKPETASITANGTVATITPLAGETVPWSVQQVGYGDGQGKTVWIIDSGVATNHADLTVDVARSKSFVGGITSVEDGYGHGTAVAGVIAAKNNGSGLVGVAAGATVVALRVFNDAGAGTLSSAISAVNHVNQNAKAGDVVNMSLGSGISSTLDNLVKSAASKGILFAVAAGNSGVDCASTSPARVDAPNVYTVSAMDSNARLWASSNYGLSVDFSAPGVGITAINKNGGLNSCNGTSFAAPHVAGILLLRGSVVGKGTITGDRDSRPDPIAALN